MNYVYTLFCEHNTLLNIGQEILYSPQLSKLNKTCLINYMCYNHP